jgi:hypothetical protein
MKPCNKRLQQSWLLARFVGAHEQVPMPRYRSAAKQLRRTLVRQAKLGASYMSESLCWLRPSQPPIPSVACM